ncbi:hypothetical protein SSX86_001633 [Deinandra increscens subsp. villosa]|uniref:Reverse transcriptase Ty1/copia-type domain-containing protein n=1 Tax=Deinandra increscens subsp. villosa TaxID=3103831 RepID=A0AAP0DZG4_9ASTR
MLISRHVLFNETSFPFKDLHTSPPTYNFLDSAPHPSLWTAHNVTSVPTNSSFTPPSSSIPSPTQPSPPHSPSAPVNQTSPTQPSSPSSSSPGTSPSPSPPSPPPPPTRAMRTRSMSGISKPKIPFNLHTSTTLSPLPRNPIDALNNPDWKHAMLDEFRALIDNKTWVLVPRHYGMNIVHSMWVFRHKLKSDGTLERYKARLVCDGRSQTVGIDCGETFSPVVKPATIRTVLTLALNRNWPIHQLDVKNAFLHGDLSETVYMHQPVGFRHPKYPDHVCLLKKSLYGLKQAPRAWYKRFADYVLRMGFYNSKCDNSLFVYRRGNDTAYLLLYVDDIILVTSSDTLRAKFMKLLASEFAMKDLGPLTFFLGIAVTRPSPGSMFLSQQRYARDILRRAGLESCNPVSTPVDTQSKLSATAGTLLDDPTTYRQLVGALQYLTITRPDISYAVQQVCMHMHAPRSGHMNALKRILRYIQGTLSYGLTFSQSNARTLVAYTDADWAGCPDTRRSTSGYCVYLGANLLTWSSKRQPTVSRSSGEAEYRAVANVVSETCWLRNLLCELFVPPDKATLVYCDNVSVVYLSSNPVQHQRTKHIELDIHFVWEKVAKGQVRVLHVPSRYQIADIFTKGLPRILFDDFRSSLNIRQPPVSTAGVY